jgi:predicted phosphodiesterase
MPRIAFFSDLHLDHYSHGSAIIDHVCRQVDEVKPDILINLGDTIEQSHQQDFVSDHFSRLGPRYLEVKGNHDFYRGEFPSRVMNVTVVEGIKFVMGTMWTHFDHNDEYMEYARKGIADFDSWIGIQGVSTEKMRDHCLHFLGVVEAEKPDVVLSHFAPSPRSVHPRFLNGGSAVFNHYFCPDCEETIRRARPRHWLHGHVHDPHSYEIEETVVSCNPLGYPGETYRTVADYKLKVIEI